MMAYPEVSIVIATAGPAPYIDRVLQSVARQTYGACEVIVVDNNRNQRISSCIGAGPLHPVKVLHECTPGLSRARNRGINASRGQIVAFIDDDAIPDEDWVMELVSGITRHGSAVAGGTVELILPQKLPPWFCDEIQQMLSALSYDRIDIPAISLSQYIVGANMCITRSALDAFGGFNVDFGRIGSLLRSSEELEFCRRLQRVGGRVSFIANARVWHQIPEERLSLAYLHKRAYWQGVSDVLLEMTHGRPRSFGSRSSLANLKCLIVAFGAILKSSTQNRPVSCMRAVREAGYMIEFARRTRAGATLHSAEEIAEAAKSLNCFR